MSKVWHEDVAEMHEAFFDVDAIRMFDAGRSSKLLDFRVDFLREEMRELVSAVEDERAEDVVDALVDLVVVAIGTMHMFGIDAGRAWDEVHSANMKKRAGVKPNRPNPLGLPDLMKPEGWVGPSHVGNTGTLFGAGARPVVDDAPHVVVEDDRGRKYLIPEDMKVHWYDMVHVEDWDGVYLPMWAHPVEGDFKVR